MSQTIGQIDNERGSVAVTLFAGPGVSDWLQLTPIRDNGNEDTVQLHLTDLKEIIRLAEMEI